MSSYCPVPFCYFFQVEDVIMRSWPNLSCVHDWLTEKSKVWSEGQDRCSLCYNLLSVATRELLLCQKPKHCDYSLTLSSPLISWWWWLVACVLYSFLGNLHVNYAVLFSRSDPPRLAFSLLLNTNIIVHLLHLFVYIQSLSAQCQIPVLSGGQVRKSYKSDSQQTDRGKKNCKQ